MNKMSASGHRILADGAPSDPAMLQDQADLSAWKRGGSSDFHSVQGAPESKTHQAIKAQFGDDHGLHQGDMVAPLSPDVLLETAASSDSEKWAAWALWPAGVVTYRFDANLATCAKSAFLVAVSEFEKFTCVRFKEFTSTSSGIALRVSSDPATGCWAYVGYSASSQVNLGGSGCHFPGIALHELGHVLGLLHEQSRLNRDLFVTVSWANVMSGQERNFYKISSGSVWEKAVVDKAYDAGSVMHYGVCEFSISSTRVVNSCRRTIDPFDKSVVHIMGNRDHLTDLDIGLINEMYSCTMTCSDGKRNQGETGVDCGGPCRRVCEDSKDDGIVPLTPECEISRALTYKEIIILSCIALAVAFIAIAGFRFVRHKFRKSPGAATITRAKSKTKRKYH
jgi:hypothetical protein